MVGRSTSDTVAAREYKLLVTTVNRFITKVTPKNEIRNAHEPLTLNLLEKTGVQLKGFVLRGIYEQISIWEKSDKTTVIEYGRKRNDEMNVIHGGHSTVDALNKSGRIKWRG